MKLTIRQLEYIVAVADSGQFSIAAKQLNVAQPSLSAQIADCEFHLGARIFDRDRNGARATHLGEEIIRRARIVLDEAEQLFAIATERQIFDGRLRLGVLPSIGPYILPSVVRALHAKFPDLKAVIKDANTVLLQSGLRDGTIDFAISTPEDHPNTLHSPLFEERFWVAFAPDDSLARQKAPIGQEQLSGRTLLTLDTSHRLARIVHELASRTNALVSPDYSGDSLDTIRMMAATGTGVAILPEIYAMAVGKNSRGIVMRRIDLDIAHRRIVLVQKQTKQPIPGTELLAEELTQQAQLYLEPR